MKEFKELNVGDRFFTNYGNELEVVFKSGETSCCDLKGELYLYNSDGIMLTHTNDIGFEDFAHQSPITKTQ